MKRFALLALALAAQSVAAQQPARLMVGRPLRPAQNPPTLPLRHVIERPSHVKERDARRPPRSVVYVPAAIPYYATQPAPQVSVNITNVVEAAPPSGVYYGIAPASQVAMRLGPDWRYWDPVADMAAERAASSDLDPAAAGAPAAADDVRSLDALIAAYYDVHSGARGTPRNWGRFRSLFVEGARLIATRGANAAPPHPTVMTPETYAIAATPVLEQGVFQREVARRVERFGTIANVFSTYEVRRMSGDEKPYQRGINSMQLLNDGTRWWIMSVSWDAERSDNPIPAKYLPPR